MLSVKSGLAKIRIRSVAVFFAFVILPFLFLCFSPVGCSTYDPSLYPSYDVLNPGAEVRLNPLGFTADGNVIVNPAFVLWVEELKTEIIKLRKEK